jgi:hypothetical protein
MSVNVEICPVGMTLQVVPPFDVARILFCDEVRRAIPCRLSQNTMRFTGESGLILICHVNPKSLVE